MIRRFMSNLGSIMLMYSTVSNNPIDFTGRDFGAKMVKQQYKDGIYYVYFNKPITQIPEQTFKYTDLNYIQFSESVSHIGDYAFEECDDLISITIPDNVSSFGNGVFKQCTNLTTVNITHSSQLTCIPTYTFDDCVNLTSITIPTNIITVENYAFRNCNNLASVRINSIANWCNIQFGDYGSNPLYYRSNLYLNGELITELIIPDGVTNIKDRSFQSCSHITSVTLSKSLTHIGKYTFFGCEKLESVNIPKDSQLMSINDYAFDSCLNLTKVNIGSLEEWCNIQFTTSESNPLTGAERLYLNGELITELIIPENITSIGNYAFNYNTRITSIIIPADLTSIGDEAFVGCENLKTVINYSDLSIEVGSTSHGYVAYYADRVINTDYFIDGYCFITKDGVHYLTGYIGDDTDLTLPADHKGENYQIDTRAFYNCSNITSITIPENSKLTSIGNGAFRGCTGLTSITIPESVTSIGNWAFYDCYSLTAVHINSIEAWYKISFKDDYYSNPLYYANNLYLNGELVTELVIPDELTSIGERAFVNCSSLTTITIPENSQLTRIGNGAFYGCVSINEIHISSLEQWLTINYGNASSHPNCDASNVKLYIDDWTGTYELNRIIIPSNITVIPAYAFRNCTGITYLSIHSSVTEIGSYAFKNCSGLTEIHSGAQTPPTIQSTTFDGVNKSIPVYVPRGCVYIYSITSHWADFRNYPGT